MTAQAPARKRRLGRTLAIALLQSVAIVLLGVLLDSATNKPVGHSLEYSLTFVLGIFVFDVVRHVRVSRDQCEAALSVRE